MGGRDKGNQSVSWQVETNKRLPTFLKVCKNFETTSRQLLQQLSTKNSRPLDTTISCYAQTLQQVNKYFFLGLLTIPELSMSPCHSAHQVNVQNNLHLSSPKSLCKRATITSRKAHVCFLHVGLWLVVYPVTTTSSFTGYHLAQEALSFRTNRKVFNIIDRLCLWIVMNVWG